MGFNKILEAKGLAMANATVKVVLKLNAQPDKLAELRSLLLDLAAQSRKENGCIDYQVLQSSSDPCEFVAIEEWTDNAVLDAHMASPHVGAALAKGPSVLAKNLERAVYSAVR